MRHVIWRNRASAILGLVVMLVPFTGFPELFKESLIVLSGFLIVVFGFSRSYNSYALVENSVNVTIDSSPEKEAEKDPK